jgi:hypothetical protein
VERNVKKIDQPEKLELEDVGLENLLRDWKRGSERTERLREGTS